MKWLADGSVQELSIPGGGGAGIDVNSSGHVVGFSGGFLGFALPAVGTFGAGWNSEWTQVDWNRGFLLGVNDHGDIVGISGYGTNVETFSMVNAELLDIGPGIASDINNNREVIGGLDLNFGGNFNLPSKEGVTNAPWIWDAVNGRRALSDLLDESGSGYVLGGVNAINDRGQIVGFAYYPTNDGFGPYHAILLTPVPEPSTFVLAGFGILCALLPRIRRSRRRALAGAASLLLLLRPIAFATLILYSLATPASAVTIPTVPVGNAGNAGEVQSVGTFGAVAYDYRIGKTEVTVGQYTAFLNAVAATDTYALYSTSMATDLIIAGISRTGASGSYTYSVIGSANKPVTYVSWGDAARFSNWLHNGQPTGVQDASTTEDGAYTLNGATSDAALRAVSRNPGAVRFIPSEDEWYKAAYHKNNGVTGNYWDYPTSTDSVPYSDQPPGSDAPTQSNTANFYFDDGRANGYNDGYAVTGSTSLSGSQNYLTDAGAYTLSSSPYGTYDQGGNVFEWNEALIFGPSRGLRGGSWGSNLGFGVKSSYRISNNPSGEHSSIGFRVATVPEPSTAVLAGLGLFGMLGAAYRRRKC